MSRSPKVSRQVPVEERGGNQSQAERRLKVECEQLKPALAEATVRLRLWQKGAEYVGEGPSPMTRIS